MALGIDEVGRSAGTSKDHERVARDPNFTLYKSFFDTPLDQVDQGVLLADVPRAIFDCRNEEEYDEFVKTHPEEAPDEAKAFFLTRKYIKHPVKIGDRCAKMHVVAMLYTVGFHQGNRAIEGRPEKYRLMMFGPKGPIEAKLQANLTVNTGDQIDIVILIMVRISFSVSYT